ncbi:hypothetical protein LMxysn_2174 [Listeria monocytogenes]|nr:hypothetical protein LMxysn_2174 [Listeria monocytogenes]
MTFRENILTKMLVWCNKKRILSSKSTLAINLLEKIPALFCLNSK